MASGLVSCFYVKQIEGHIGFIKAFAAGFGFGYFLDSFSQSLPPTLESTEPIKNKNHRRSKQQKAL